METTNLEQLNIELLSTMWKGTKNNPELREDIEDILQEKIQTNSTYSREELFNHSVIQGHVLTVYFIPTTEAYEVYGPYITVNVSFDEDEKIEMLKNIYANPPRNTVGTVTAEVLLTEDDLTSEQIDRLKHEGFETNEIMKIC